MTTPVTRHIAEIEDALAKAFSGRDFEIVHYKGERYLEPILRELVIDAATGVEVPSIRLHDIARDLERHLS